MSPPRMLSSHATSSSPGSSITVAPSRAMSSRRPLTLSAADTPASLSFSRNAGCALSAGRSCQISPTRSLSAANVISLSASTFCSFLTMPVYTTRPSKPSVPPLGSFCARYSSTVGTPGSLIFISLKPLPSSCAAA